MEFVSGPIDTQKFTKAPPQPVPFGLEAREIELLPIKKSVGDYLKFGAAARLSQATEGGGPPIAILQYLRRQNIIMVQVYGIKPTDVEHTLNISSFVDLPGRNVAVHCVRGSYGTSFYLDYLAVRTQAGDLEIDKFSRYYLRQKPVFVGEVRKGRAR